MNTSMHNKIFKSLRQAHLQKPIPEAGPYWQSQTMHKIKALPPLGQQGILGFQQSALGLFDLLVWRMVPVSALLTIMLTVGIVTYNPVNEIVAADLAEYPTEYAMNLYYGDF